MNLMKNNKEFVLTDYIRKISTIENDMIIDDAFLYLNSNYEAMAQVKKNKNQ